MRGPLTRNIGAKFDEVRDEIRAAFTDEVPIKNGLNLLMLHGVFSTETLIMSLLYRMGQSSGHGGYQEDRCQNEQSPFRRSALMCVLFSLS